MTGWDDERLDEAYRALADRPAPAQLTAVTVAAVRRAADERPRRRGPLASFFGRPASRLLGGAVAVAFVAVIAAGLALRPATGPATGPTTGTSAGQTPGSSASPTPEPTAVPTGEPTTVDGLPVQTVSQALASVKSGAIKDDSLVAMKGWYNPMIAPSCPPR